MLFGVTGFIFEKTRKIHKFLETTMFTFLSKILALQHDKFFVCALIFLQNLNRKQQVLRTNTFFVGILRV